MVERRSDIELRELLEHKIKALDERIDIRLCALSKTLEQRFTELIGSREVKFDNLERLFKLTHENAQRAVDKAETTQTAHNVAANEWRGTLNDFKATLISRSEFDRAYSDFTAFKLEVTQKESARQGERENTKTHREDSKALIAIIVAVASVIVAIVAVFIRNQP